MIERPSVKIDMTDEEFSMLYSRLCDFFWRLDFLDTPKDGLLHTSDVCRERASAIVKIIGMEGVHREATRRHLERLGLDGSSD